MKYIKLLLLSLSFAATFTACDMTDFGDINKDPNEPSEANTGMLFTYACTYVKYFSMNSNYYYPWTQMYPGYMSEKNNNQYGAFGGPTMSTSSYYLYPLKNCQKIIDFNSDEAEKGKPAIVQFGDNANQIAVARTLMGFIYMHLTDALGPLPYTEAFQAGEENFTPVFDSQETIYAKLDADLREAYNQFNESGSLSTADILFDGDIRAWKKLNASTRMMLAIKLADVDKALSVAQKKDDVYYNRAKLIYNYMLGNPEKPYKDWSYDKAVDEIRKAIAVQELPVYVQTEGDILFAKQDYAAALACYEKVNQSDIASAATFFSAAKTKELMKAPAEEVLALMDSCVVRFTEPYTEEAAPYLLERAQARMNANQARAAMLDYDAYYKAVNGKVNDVFYYYREQAALKAKQFQRALNDMEKAIELSPKDLTYRAELAVVNIRVGRNEEALKVLQDALAIDSKYAEAYRLMGIAQLQMKKKQEACQSFAKAKELGDPNVDGLIEKHCK